MGDFKPSSELHSRLPKEIQLGIENHRLVDRLTDAYQPVKSLKPLFSENRRRFSGVLTDIAFDYFLIKHWSSFAEVELQPFITQCYLGLNQSLEYMPPRMQVVIKKMTKQDWLNNYATLHGISITINGVSKRIRFENKMSGGVAEIERNYDVIEMVFLELFDHLKHEVDAAGIEVA